MTQPTVIRVGKGDNAAQFWCQLVQSPLGDQSEIIDIDIDAAGGADGEDVVRTVGAQLFGELCKNTKVKDAIDHILKSRDGVQPIYIDPAVLSAQAIKWETLWQEDLGFLALNSRWPIARRAEPQFGFETRVKFKPPLRILAVISADNIPGEPEWNALRNAVELNKSAEFPIEIHVLTGEEELYQRIKQENLEGISVGPVLDSASKLDIAIGTFKPHVLHFFCHGDIDQSAWLYIRTNLDNAPLKLSVDELLGYQAVKKVWLVVLNSCRGATVLEDAASMACQFVTKGGVPFAIGATEPLDARDANTFSDAFYARLFHNFSNGFSAARPDDEITFEWTEALHAGRAAIDAQYEKRSGKFQQWTLPVLYERRDRFQITRDAAQTAVAGTKAAASEDIAALRLKIAMEYLAALPPDTPEAAKKALIAAALANAPGA